MINVISYFICSLINVMLSTVKNIFTVKASKPVATGINAISYGFNTIVLKQLVGFDFITTVIITIITNIIGVYLSLVIIEKFKKECLWKISVTIDKDISNLLEKYNISYVYNIVKYKNKEFYCYDIFSENKQDSTIIKQILTEYKVKYNITEITKSL